MGQNPTSETRNPKQIQNPNVQNGKGRLFGLRFSSLVLKFVSDFGIQDSDFGFLPGDHL
jgi:hypothetical protein